MNPLKRQRSATLLIRKPYRSGTSGAPSGAIENSPGQGTLKACRRPGIRHPHPASPEKGDRNPAWAPGTHFHEFWLRFCSSEPSVPSVATKSSYPCHKADTPDRKLVPPWSPWHRVRKKTITRSHGDHGEVLQGVHVFPLYCLKNSAQKMQSLIPRGAGRPESRTSATRANATPGWTPWRQVPVWDRRAPVRLSLPLRVLLPSWFNPPTIQHRNTPNSK